MKILNSLSLVIVLTILFNGCGFKAKAYIARRDRVDQGPSRSVLLKGDMQVASIEPKKTREVIVVEVTRDKKNQDIDRQTIQGEFQSKEFVKQEISEVSDRINSQESESRASVDGNNLIVAPSELMATNSYTVQKDDTLQKIAKQLLGSYAAWTKIYEANKDKIENPDILKPGIILTIPE